MSVFPYLAVKKPGFQLFLFQEVACFISAYVVFVEGSHMTLGAEDLNTKHDEWGF